MKRFISTLMAAVLTAALLIPGAAAAGEGGVTYDLSVNGSYDVTVPSGETVTVVFAVTSTDEIEISTLQNEIYYDTQFFELVSCEPAADSGAWVADRQRVNGDHVIQVTYFAQQAITDRTEFAEIRLKVLAASGSSTVRSKTLDGEYGVGAGVEAYRADGGGSVPITLQPVTVRVESPSYDGGSSSSYPINVESAGSGTVALSTEQSFPGDTVTVTPQPNRFYSVDSITITDYLGRNIAVRDNGNGTYSFIMPAGEVTVAVSYAHTDCPSDSYVDVIKTEWYHEAVDYVLAQQYFMGTSDTTFEPDAPMTRAMFATVIARMEGIDESAYSGGGVFDDVPAGQWYTAAVTWCAENGIVLGYGDGRFGPDDLITREQMAAMLYRYTNYVRASLAETGVSLDAFADCDRVSGWAELAMEWATLSDLLHGTGADLVEPLRNVSRAEMAQLLMNYDFARQ